MRAGKEMVFVADYVREQKEEKHVGSTWSRPGIRRQLTPDIQFALGAGAGIGEESERCRVTVSVQDSF